MQADINNAFNTTSRYSNDILNINNVYFDNKNIPKPRFRLAFVNFLMILFLPKFMINVTTLILKVSISHF